MLNEGISVQEISTKLNKSTSTIYTVQQNKSKIMDFYKNSNVPAIIRTFKRMRKPKCSSKNDNSITEETLLVEAKSMKNKEFNSTKYKFSQR
ncbi:hypothetical protein A3Q56_08446 [Intoshia linei]|uniref:Uncharacterized protein n=1 Tax=Intoshia linei TaxID=1819745 RepID=A0A177APB5_9BILA|nr:hypothetical protein A3Q56_08446 [Intoshia linei]